MILLKKIDLYIFKRFFMLFLMTFLICIFILLLQFLWKHFAELVGKGIGIDVLAEFFLYAIFSLIPLALPLAILLASLMTFGNLGENFELTAMKSAGISLFRIIRPLIVFIAMVSVGAFYFSNYVLPISQTKLWTLIFSLRQKSPEFDIPTNEFYSGINGVNLYVREKENGLLKNLMIYDFSAGFNNATVMVADSGRVKITEDKKYLLLTLYDGENFENLKNQRMNNAASNIPYRREVFAYKEILLDFDSDFTRFDESILEDQHVSKNIKQLTHSIDSVNKIVDIRIAEQAAEIVANNKIYDYSDSENNAEKKISETDRCNIRNDISSLLISLYTNDNSENFTNQKNQNTTLNIPYRLEESGTKKYMFSFDSELAQFETDSFKKIVDTAPAEQAAPIVASNNFKNETKSAETVKTLKKISLRKYDSDTLLMSFDQGDLQIVASTALQKAKEMQNRIEYNNITLGEPQKYVSRHEIEWHRKFTLSFACLIFFFIGAPLGAIIRKGGLGAPVVISVIMFIIYYIIDNTGYKMAREGLWTAFEGMWLSSSVLLPLGIFLTYKSAVDATLFNVDQYLEMWKKFKQNILLIVNRKSGFTANEI